MRRRGDAHPRGTHLSPLTGNATVSSRLDAVAQVNHAGFETAFVQQFELQADIVGEELLAASHDDGRDVQVAFVDQPGPERLRGKVSLSRSARPS